MELHHQSTDPPVLNVEVESYPNAGGAGFVVCLIPESPFKPHRAEHLTNKPYYIRAGDDFVIPSPALLRHLFFPHTYSHLWVEAAVTVAQTFRANSKGFQLPDGADVSYNVRLHNSGTATAQDVFVVLQTDIIGASFNVGPDWTAAANPQGQAAFEGRRPLHPGAVSYLFTLTHRSQLPKYHSHRTELPHVDEVSLRFLIYARDREPQVAVISFLSDEIEGQTVKQGVAEVAHWHRHLPGGRATP